jgi:hypothetical protein
VASWPGPLGKKSTLTTHKAAASVASTSLHGGSPDDAHDGSGKALPADDNGVAKLPIVNS